MKIIILLILLFPQFLQAESLKSSTTGFVENLGQLANYEGRKVNNVLFYSKSNDIGVFITTTGVSYVIYRNEEIPITSGENDLDLQQSRHQKSTSLHFARIDIDLINSTLDRSKIEFSEELPGCSNYYYTHCPEGILNVKTYNEVRIKEVYNGIDWIWRYDSRGVLHHEFELSTDAEPEDIKLKIKWADYELNSDGKKLMLYTPHGKIEDGWVIGHNSRSVIFPVEVRYKETGGLISYEVMNWDRNENLIIDPPLALTWATHYGGSEEADICNSITADVSGNAFATGWTGSTSFPTQNPGGGAYFQGSIAGRQEVFILKFSNVGVRSWATFYGGSDDDYGKSITTDDSGNVFVTASTRSGNLPTQNPGGGSYFQGSHAGVMDAFILKFSNLGVRSWATYYGGSLTDNVESITTDVSGNVYVTGYTNSTNFPTQNPGSAYFQGSNAGIYDAFILKFSNVGIRSWATYYGGSANDYCYSITTDVTDNVFVTGRTNSTNFPTQDPGSGAYFQGSNAGNDNAFILKFSNVGNRSWATYYGGSANDYCYSITTDVTDNVFVTGRTNSNNFPTQNPGGGAYFQGSNAGSDDAFILKFSNVGVRSWATYYGGSASDYCYSITTDVTGNVFVTGRTSSTNFPTQDPGSGAYFQGIYGGNIDALILKFNNAGVRNWATYFGGNGSDNCFSITTDDTGNVFVSGNTFSTNFPTQNPGGGAYFQGSQAGLSDAFISKFDGTLMFTLNLTLNLEACSPSQDTILVKIKSIVSPYNTVDIAEVYLTPTGTVSINYYYPSNGISYYIVVNHRNSIETWSKYGGEIFSSGVMNYDFTTAQSQAFGNNLILVGSEFSNYTADVNQDEVVDGTDGSLIGNDAEAFETGYVVTDLNCDNIVDGGDAIYVDNNSANFVVVAKP